MAQPGCLNRLVLSIIFFFVRLPSIAILGNQEKGLSLGFSVSLLLRGGGAIGRGIIGTSAIAIGGGPTPRGQRCAPLLTRPGLPGGGSGGSRGLSPGRRLCKGASSPLLRGPKANGAEAGPQRGAARSGGAERSRPGAGK